MGLFNWFGKTDPPVPSASSADDSRPDAAGGELDREIESVAVLIDDRPAFRARAREVAGRYGPDVLPELRQRLHFETPPPPGFTSKERGLAAWLSCWQFAIFEVIYNYREHALPMLREVAFDGYDWTQANAAEVLCRLAAEGIDRERTLAGLRREMPVMRDTALLYIAGPLLAQADTNPALAAVVAELRDVPEFEMAVRELMQSDRT